MSDLEGVSIAGNYLCVPCSTVFGNTLLGRVIYKDQTKAFPIAVAPLEIVRERPVEIPAYVGTILNCVLKAEQIALQKINAIRIVHLSVQKDTVVAALAVLCDIQRQAIPLMEQGEPPSP